MSNFSPRQALAAVGVVIGLVLGLTYQWAINPVKLVNTQPALLRTDYRWDWVRMTALSYVADGNLERVHTRLDGLEQNDVIKAMEALIEEYAAASHSADTLRRLTTLGEKLGVHTPAMLVYLHTPGAPSPTPSPTLTPTPTFSPTPSPTFTPTPTPTPTRALTHTPTPTSTYPTSLLNTPTPQPTTPPTPTPPLLARLQVAQQKQVCEPDYGPHIEVVVQDERGVGITGVVVWLMWSSGADRAVTGLKPQHGAGYVDFNAQPNAHYSLGVGESGRPLITDLQFKPCPAGEGTERLIGSWHIVLEPQGK